MKDGVEKFIKSTVWVAIIFFGLRCGVSWKSIVENISIYDLFGYAGEAVGLATVIMAAYERWLWRINPFETTPALKKIYTGKIVSSYDNIERPIELPIVISITQGFTSIPKAKS